MVKATSDSNESVEAIGRQPATRSEAVDHLAQKTDTRRIEHHVGTLPKNVDFRT